MNDLVPPENAEPDVVDDDELPRWRRFLKWLRTPMGLIVTGVVVALGVGVWQARPLYKATKHWRAAKLVAEAEEAEARGDEAVAQDRFVMLFRLVIVMELA